VGQKHIQFINQQKHVSMKKLLFLTALFTSLLIGFAACSDIKEDVPFIDEGDPIQQYTIEGLLTYDDATNRYALAVSKCTNEAVLDLASKDKIYIDPDKVSEIVYPTLKDFVGKYISTKIGIDDVGRLLGNGMLTLESEILLAEARSTKDIFCDDTPDIFPEAYTTTPLQDPQLIYHAATTW
ncbi:MAG: hypothetical protein K2K33_02655, partial [Muribaculaceae bacterium]|nr:hypothetical protein [Muribaculaceae bacterium]